MNATAMTLVLLVSLGAFAWSASRRWRLLLVTRSDPRITLDRDSLAKRFRNVLVIAGLQKKLPANEKYRLEVVAHIAIFVAFSVLLLNTVLLWGRGYDASFDFWGLFGENTLQWRLYSTSKELIAALCVLGACAFVYDRAIRRLKRMTLGAEGLIILGIIITMMLADFLYVGARGALLFHHAGSEVTWRWPTATSSRRTQYPTSSRGRAHARQRWAGRRSVTPNERRSPRSIACSPAGEHAPSTITIVSSGRSCGNTAAWRETSAG